MTVKAKESRIMEDWLAEHMSKHLADKVLNLSGLPTDHPSRADLLNKILPEGRTIEASDPVEMNDKLLNMKDDVPPEPPKQAKKRQDKEVFEGLA